MNTRLFLLTLLFPFCCVLLKAQSSNTTVTTETTTENYENEDADEAQGLVIGEVISGKGAALAGLQPGDVVTTVDGKAIKGIGTLRSALAGHQPGDPVTVVYLRDGQAQETKVTLSSDRNSFNNNFRRDPCAVFIGVYTSDATVDGKGVEITGVIAGTPAKESDLQLGDVILALDGQSVHNFTELHRERDKHQAGDAFQLTILRGGATLTVNAKFKACPKVENTPQPTPEVVETAPVKQPENTALASPETTLEVALDLFPNPTAEVLTVRFEAEAVPTTVRIADAAGKTVYSNVMTRFSGLFSEQISLADQKPGIYTLTVRQGKKLISKNIVLVTRT
ncbi:MAG: PDZ domain-containing protein [Saprospiraceae bacterium]|nr:PDZ domain-containing protein [Saprospiraceae bacterium]